MQTGKSLPGDQKTGHSGQTVGGITNAYGSVWGPSPEATEITALKARIAALEAVKADALADVRDINAEMQDQRRLRAAAEAKIARVKAFAAKLKATEDTEWGWGVKREWGVRIEVVLQGETP